jgi:hypothetical protein
MNYELAWLTPPDDRHAGGLGASLQKAFPGQSFVVRFSDSGVSVQAKDVDPILLRQFVAGFRAGVQYKENNS